MGADEYNYDDEFIKDKLSRKPREPSFFERIFIIIFTPVVRLYEWFFM